MLTALKLAPVRRSSAHLTIGQQLLIHAAAGVLIGWAVLASLLALDVGHLGTLLRQADQAAMILAMLALQFGAGFAVFVMATGVFLLRS
jgi:hypothetical protein